MAAGLGSYRWRALALFGIRERQSDRLIRRKTGRKSRRFSRPIAAYTLSLAIFQIDPGLV